MTDPPRPPVSQTEEVWRPSPVRGDRYEISDRGCLRRRRNDGTYRISNPYTDSEGYQIVQMTIDGRRRKVRIHRLVAGAFVEGDGPVVRHLDGNPSNNTPSNLAWGTQAENVQDMIQHGNHVMGRKTHCKKGHPFDETNTRFMRRGRVCRACEADYRKTVAPTTKDPIK